MPSGKKDSSLISHPALNAGKTPADPAFANLDVSSCRTVAVKKYFPLKV